MSLFSEIVESKILHLIGGRPQTFSDERFFENISSSDDSLINEVVAGGRHAVDAAVLASQKGLKESGWDRWAVDKRASCLLKMADLIIENLPILLGLRPWTPENRFKKHTTETFRDPPQTFAFLQTLQGNAKARLLKVPTALFTQLTANQSVLWA